MMRPKKKEIKVKKMKEPLRSKSTMKVKKRK
jgi:hypothetical protein